ncbi:uncharacterized protein LOC129749761 [Uranotaenia lowii]|uniref:uncharacterized protein LOC129749761 n=1 Tax=Uranotaenia lowii TaxID=190385 RepID=UPI002479D4C4|nr:uncharacterized protein LOC129749761 [Uranotaenia lowii]XP_055600807.1 uncharacterized protein LOC129749761 [Uranotaenia lowii]
MPTVKASKDSRNPSLKYLIVKLKEIQSSFSDVWEFVETFQEDATHAQISVRLSAIDDLWERFGEVLVDIKSHEDFVADLELYDKERKEFSDRYYFAKSFLMDKAKVRLEFTELDHSVRAGESNNHGGFDHVRLPQIKLQSFNGNIDEWLGFRDLYISLIHCKPDLPEVEKFHYLKGCLQGEPKSLIDPLQITRANYVVAWDILLKRYNNSKQLKKRQVQSLFKLPSVNKESVNDLLQLLEGFERIVNTLDQVLEAKDYKDLLLVNYLVSLLDPVTRRSWEEESASKKEDTLADLTEFLHRRVRVLEALPPKLSDSKGVPPQMSAKQRVSVRTFHNNVNMNGFKCFACNGQHPLHQCQKFLKLSVSERDSLLKNHSLCRNCFRTSHMARECQSKFSCRNCGGRHHTLVCFKGKDGEISESSRSGETNGTSKSNQLRKETSCQVSNTASSSCLTSGVERKAHCRVLLATAVVLLEDEMGNRYPARALLDSGSESNFMSERLSQRLKMSRKRVDVAILGIGRTSTRVKHKVQAVVRSRVNNYFKEMEFLVLPKVTVDLPTATVSTNEWSFPNGIELADPSFFESRMVDLVLGIESFFDFFESGKRISIGDQLPTLTESVFGWVVSGGLSQGTSARIACNVSTTESLETLVARFWACEELGSENLYSREERRCEEVFQKTIQRDSNGRYTVSLPKNEEVFPNLGDSREIALRRLGATERRLARNSELRELYTKFMDEYIQLGHMREVVETSNTKRCFLPHHPVEKESSTTTKLRVVFDASCKTTTGISLNDGLLSGPVIQDDLRAIILRCRMCQIMVVADIEKMFRQINVAHEDRPLQSILWRNSPSEPVRTFELNTVTYGTKPAPFLATRTLKQLALDEAERFPLASRVFLDDTYMDDVVSGADDATAALKLRIQLDKAAKAGGFRLRKFASNCAEVLQGLSQDSVAIEESSDGSEIDPSMKILGLTWLPKSDVFKYNFNNPDIPNSTVLTKRKVLSVIATLFDPLGLLGAAITTAKIFMQQLWTLRNSDDQRLDWDQPLPPTVGEDWLKYYEQLVSLNNVRIERCNIIPKAIHKEIHCFSDASEKAYGGCVYLKSVNPNGEVKICLLSAKSRVAPLASQSIPRLELCGALLTAELFKFVQESMKLECPVIFWTDSTCVWRWLQAVPSTWTTYVANRVAKIQQLTEGFEWRHVPGVDNPADLISRGIPPAEIGHTRLWWEGPAWLALERENWPERPDNHLAEMGEEEKRRTTVTALTTNITEHESDFNRWFFSLYSDYTKMVRCTAYLLRFMKLLRSKRQVKFQPFLQAAEMDEAERALAMCVQKECFAEELKALSKGDFVSRQSKLRWFNPKVFPDGLLRIGGRLSNSTESEAAKHPIVLPARHDLTRLILEHFHRRLLHAGPQLLLATVRLKFWPLGGRGVARQVVQKCHTCFKARPTPIQQFMAELPVSRVTVSRAFSKAGVDYFGPIYIRPAPRRPVVKAYVAIFVCMSTKAVHLELVSDLSTERFIQALRRFVGRRGKCVELFSDNGTNFVGARNQMSELLSLLKSQNHREKLYKECGNDGIKWHFNPPSAPHFGGLWEAAVRSAKKHILRVIGENPVSSEDFTTLLVQVEACLNSRPITPLSNDPNDLEPLTPGHFIIGESLQSMPDKTYEQIPDNRLDQMQLMQKNIQLIWKRWHREYLCQLQARTKRWKPSVFVEIGSLVIIKDENTPPCRWKMGRVVELHPGQDGITRVVTLKTESGLKKRPVEKLCLLPMSDSIEITDQNASEIQSE